MAVMITQVTCLDKSVVLNATNAKTSHGTLTKK